MAEDPFCKAEFIAEIERSSLAHDQTLEERMNEKKR
jgi:hypothetical protein